MQRSRQRIPTHSVSSWVVAKGQQMRLRRAANRYVAPLHMPYVLPWGVQLQRVALAQELPALQGLLFCTK